MRVTGKLLLKRQLIGTFSFDLCDAAACPMDKGRHTLNYLIDTNYPVVGCCM